MFEAALQQIRLQGFYYWVVKRAKSLFNSFGAKSQNKLRVFVARFILYLNFKVTFCRLAQGKAQHSYSRWSHLIEPQEGKASVLFIWMVPVNLSPTGTKVNWFQWRPLATHTFLSWREYLQCLRKQALCFDNSPAFRSLLLLEPNRTNKIKIIISGAPDVNFRKITVRKTIWDPEFSEHLL